ncbi:HFLK protein [Ruminococcaceae bacterium OttesenSCG-928-I18]|nr:HFLK protein [Ruminococcaceae bacterium OttesenSCG-928-I18]
MDNWDFGHFGKGTTGYAHYKAAFDRTQKNSGGGGGKGQNNNNGGCLSCLLLMALPAVSIITLWLVR